MSGPAQAITLFASAILLCSCVLLTKPRAPASAQERLATFPQSGRGMLSAPVSVHWSELLVPFIEAESSTDLAFALGMVHSHLRLSQMEMLKRVSQGRLAEVAGPFAQRIDHSLRILQLNKGTHQVVAALPDDTREYLGAYVQGINNYIAQATNLPHEFRALGIEPEPWTIDDVITLSRLISADVNWLMWFGQLPLLSEPAWPAFWAEMKAIHARSLPSFLSGSELDGLASHSHSGSNAFALSGRLTATGSPLLAGDPHVGFQFPNLWLIAGIHSPELHCVGLMVAGIPVILMGRNAEIAWGGTNMRSLSSSLTPVSAEELSSARVQSEKLQVRWWFDKQIERRETTAGNIITDAPLARDRTVKHLALHWIGHEPSDELTAFLRLNKAANWEQVRQAFTTYAVSGQNIVFADRHGNIGQLMAVRLPDKSAAYDESFLTMPGYERTGTIGSLELPSAYNPQGGYLVSANNAPAAASQIRQGQTRAALYFSSNDRVERLNQIIQEFTTSNRRIGVADVSRIQLDVCVPSAKRVRDALISFWDKRLPVSPGERATVIDAIRSWDGCYSTASRGALAFSLFQYYFVEDFFTLAWGERFAEYILGTDVVNDFILLAFAQPVPDTFSNVALADVIDRALSSSAYKLKFFADWGDFHRLALSHPFAALPLVGRWYKSQDFAVDGSSQTLMKTAAGLTDRRHRSRYGANARHIFDMGNLNANYFVLLGGQDGQWGSPQALDQVQLWQKGQYILLPLDPQEARKQASWHTQITP